MTSLSLPWTLTISVFPVKKKDKFAWTISYSNKVLMNFDHDVPNS